MNGICNKLAGTAFLFLAFVAVNATAQQRPPAPVEVAAAEMRKVSPVLWVPGTVISREDSQIAAEVSGKLTWVAEVGDRVDKDKPLARLNTREMKLRLRNDESEIARLDARLAYLHRQVKRLDKLTRANTSAESELDELSAQRDMTGQELETARINRERTLYDIERAEIRAPFNGVVVERMQEPGEYLESGNAVVRLVNLEALEIRARAPLHTSRNISAGDWIDVKNAQQTISTRVRSVIPVGDERSRMLQLRLRLTDSNWVIGEAVRVAVQNGAVKNLLTVPRDALVLRDGVTYLFKMNGDSTVERIAVQTGEGAGDYIAVEGNIASGDEVIIRGAERLQDGSSVTVVKHSIVNNQ